LKERLFSYARARALIVAGVASALAVAALVPALASGSEGEAATANVVKIEGSRTKPLHFVFPKTIVDGEELEIVNMTNAKKVGPHTFSMVESGLIPQTKQQRKACFTPKHICKAVAEWHGVKGPHGSPTKNPAEAGAQGWDSEGNLAESGDSWFTGTKPNASFSQKVSVDTSGGPTTITFMCAIHPWMHGSIKVLPAGS
jgi:hypothetical protein